MGASFSAEILKLRKRPSTWILAAVFLAVVLLIGYALTYSFVANPPPPPEDVPPEVRAQQEEINEQQLNVLLPENVLSNLFGSGIFGVGGTVALIFGALTAGSEYGWGTLKSVLSQRPGRFGIFLGKLAAMVVFLLLFVALTLLVAALSSYVVARLEEAAVDWPSSVELLRGMGAGALIFAVWGTLGFLLATLFKGTPLAIGLGLAYALAVESILLSLPFENDAFESIRKATLAENVSAISASFVSTFRESLCIPEPLVKPKRASLTLSTYTVVL